MNEISHRYRKGSQKKIPWLLQMSDVETCVSHAWGFLPLSCSLYLQDRKKWYVLRQDMAQGYCLLEFYRDEKSATKGESPKGFINILDVVEVERLREKKQTFELLCPGVAHRLVANSEAEADEWAEVIRKLILYRRDDFRSLSLPRPVSSTTPFPASLSLTRQLTPLSSSPPVNVVFPQNPPSTTHTLVIPHPTHHPIRSDAFTFSPSPSHLASFTLVPNSYPTPPDTVVSTALPAQNHPTTTQRQVSADSGNPFPSPPSSSDSSSMCSGSNVSFDSASVMDGDTDTQNSKSVCYHYHCRQCSIDSDLLTLPDL